MATVSTGGATIGQVQGGATGLGGTTSTIPCVSADIGSTTHSAGNYDFMSCNGETCHFDVPYVGGWVYASAAGVPWIGGATVTVTGPDGKTVTAVSGKDGFFYFVDPIPSSYKACVNRCPNVDCSVTPHTSGDCQSAGCHGNANLKIYVRQGAGGGSGTGGAGGGANCKPAAPGGPYVHTDKVFSYMSCVSCHAGFVGGYLFDGPSSSTVVSEATMTLTPANGTPISAVSGPEGMLFFGTVSTKPTTQQVTAPYTACVSKCPKTICSATNGHTTTADCGTCHDGTTTGKLYLN